MESEPGSTAVADATATKLENVRASLRSMGRVLVAFSGGVDSTFMLQVAHETLGDQVVALTTVSPTNPEEDTEHATWFARQLGIEHVVIRSDELEIPGYRENPTNRCYFCKTSLYSFTSTEAERRSIETVIDGVNHDDLGDYRPGLQAAQERTVRHPLAEAELSKDEIRALSKQMGLSTWDRPASPCLSSRFPYGTEITHEGLAQVASAEQVLRDHGFRECRIRFHQEVARIEVPAADIELLLDAERRKSIAAAIRALGFRYVALDLEGFRSGSLNRGL